MILRITYFTAMMAVLSTIVLFILTHIPGKSLPDFARFNDKQLHYTAYLIVSLLYGVSFTIKGWKGILWLTLTALLLSGFAVIDEYTQQYFGRTTDIRDYYADLRGIATGVGICLVYWFIKTVCSFKINLKISK